MICTIDHTNEDELAIPRFLCVVCNPRSARVKGPRLSAVWVDPIETRQRELRAAQAATAGAKRRAGLAKYLQKIEDEHPGEEWNAKLKCWQRTERSMAKYEAKLLAEFEASAATEQEIAA